jgi:competence protein ComEC
VSATRSTIVAALALSTLGACTTERSPATSPTEPRSEATAARSGPPPEATLTMMDVGTGLAVLLRGEDFALLYDAGSNDDLAAGRESRALAYLAVALGPSGPADCAPGRTDPLAERKIDHVFLSHPHRDHLSMLPDVLRCYAVENVWEPGLDSTSDAYAAFEDAVRREPGVVWHRADAGAHRFTTGTRITMGRGVRATILSVRPRAKDPNDASVVLRVDVGPSRVLFMGDATGGGRADPSEPPARSSVEAELVAKHRKELVADVLVVGHHGSMTSSRTAFLDAVRPRYALVSSGPKPYGRVTLPDPEILGALKARGAEILRTDDDDAACRTSGAKVGADADGAPGGCSAITLSVGGGHPVVVSREPSRD